MSFRKKKLLQRGFTLVEFLLYLALAAAVLGFMTILLSLVLEARIKNQTMAEVEQQGLAVSQVLTLVIRNADAIVAPSTGTTGSSASFTVPQGAQSPTVFDLSAGAIRIREGVGAAIPLTNARVIASDITFQNLSRSGTPGTIRAQFTLSHVNPSGRNEYQFQKIFTVTATLRQP